MFSKQRLSSVKNRFFAGFGSLRSLVPLSWQAHILLHTCMVDRHVSINFSLAMRIANIAKKEGQVKRQKIIHTGKEERESGVALAPSRGPEADKLLQMFEFIGIANRSYFNNVLLRDGYRDQRERMA